MVIIKAWKSAIPAENLWTGVEWSVPNYGVSENLQFLPVHDSTQSWHFTKSVLIGTIATNLAGTGGKHVECDANTLLPLVWFKSCLPETFFYVLNRSKGWCFKERLEIWSTGVVSSLSGQWSLPRPLLATDQVPDIRDSRQETLDTTQGPDPGILMGSTDTKHTVTRPPSRWHWFA